MDRPKATRPLPQDIIGSVEIEMAAISGDGIWLTGRSICPAPPRLPDLLTGPRLICQHIRLAADPAQPQLWLDPFIRATTPQDGQNHLRTITLEASPIVQAQQTLKSLCLVSREWNSEARKTLWSSGIQFGLPRSFETVVKMVDPIGSFFDGGVEPTWLMSPPASRQSSPKRTLFANESPVSVSSGGHAPAELDQTAYRSSFSRQRSVSLKRQGGNYILQPHSRNAPPYSPPHSTRQSNSVSPGCSDENRRAFERSISPLRGRVAVQSLSQAFRRTSVSPNVYPTSIAGPGKRDDDLKEEAETDEDEFVFDHHIDDLFNPAPYIRSVSFSKYRSHGMRRSVAEGQQVRFVTPERLCRLLRSTRSRYSGLHDKDHDDTTAPSNEASESNLLLRRGKLEAVGFSEYMDSAITKGVLDEILLRGGVEAEYHVIDPICHSTKGESSAEEDLDRGRARSRKEQYTASHCASPHHTLPAPVEDFAQAYGSTHPTLTAFPISFDRDSSCSFRIERRLESSLLMETPVKALDLCGCISTKFRASIKDFIIDHALFSPSPPTQKDSASTILMNTPTGLRSTRFPFLTRLGLSRVMILDDLELSDFLSGFVNLLDLDLSHTRAGRHVLHTLQIIKKGDRSKTGSVILRPSFRSLNLTKCRGLTKDSLVGFLCGNQDGSGPSDPEQWEDPMESIGGLEELSLHGDLTQPTPLDSEALDKILASCPALLSGKLTTLDLSSVMIDDSDFDLKQKMPPQPQLLQLGLGSCPQISLETISFLLKEKMNSVEVLDISSSCVSARQRETRFGQATSVISVGKLHAELIGPVTCMGPGGRRVSNLRVIELEDASLQAIRGGVGGWKAAFGKGRRGWYVDLSVTVIIARDTSAQDRSSAPSLRRRVINRMDNRLSSGGLESMKSSTEEAEVGRLEDSLEALKSSDETIRHTEIGWMSRKTESQSLGFTFLEQMHLLGHHSKVDVRFYCTEIVLHGSGLLGRQEGLYGFHAFASN